MWRTRTISAGCGGVRSGLPVGVLRVVLCRLCCGLAETGVSFLQERVRISCGWPGSERLVDQRARIPKSRGRPVERLSGDTRRSEAGGTFVTNSRARSKQRTHAGRVRGLPHTGRALLASAASRGAGALGRGTDKDSKAAVRLL